MRLGQRIISFTLLSSLGVSGDTAAVSRSLFSRAITAARNHPVMTAAGLVGSGGLIGSGYLLYKWLHKKQVVLPSPVLPKVLGGKRDTAFLGEQVHNFGREAGLTHVFIALPGDRFASGHEYGVVKIWNAKTGECEQTIEVDKDNGEILSLCLVGSARMVASAGFGKLYLLELGNRKIQVKRIDSFGSRISTVGLFFDEKVILNFDEDRLREPAEVFDTKTGKHYPFCVQSGNNESIPERHIVFIVQLDSDRFFVVSSERKGWFGVISTESVQKSYHEQQEQLSKTREFELKKEAFQFTVPNDELIHYVAVLSDNTLILVSWDSSIRLFDGSTGSFKGKVKTSLFSRVLRKRRPVHSIVEFSKNTIIIAVENTIGSHMCVLSRDERGNITYSKECEGEAPLLLLPQGLLTSSADGAIRLVQ